MATIIPPRERFSRNSCTNLAEAETKEWLLTNGLGAYALGNIAGTLTRRYHGLLIAPVNTPLGRQLIFAKADTSLLLGQEEIPLYSSRWENDIIQPAGYLWIDSFELDGRMPVWRFVVNHLHIEMRIWMEPGQHTTYIAYRLEPGQSLDEMPIKLKVELLTNARSHHQLNTSKTLTPQLQIAEKKLILSYPDWFNCYFSVQGGTLYQDVYWKEHFLLSQEKKQGLADSENHLCVGNAILDLLPGQWAGVICSLAPNAATDLRAALNRFRSRDIETLKRAKTTMPEMAQAPAWIDRLLLATDHFIFARPSVKVKDGESVIAGYPWFGDFGRDTMIALPGLTLATGRYDSAKHILFNYGQYLDQGMLPNVFPGDGTTPQYNSVDAALWYIEAWRAYIKTTQDIKALHKIYPQLQHIIIWYLKGTRFGIVIDPEDGLLHAGVEGVQLTWMDAKVGEEVITPRIGKAVEINALWFNAVNTMTRFAYQLGLNPNPYAELVKKSLLGFQRFIKPLQGGLYDVIDGPNGNDSSIRPNQIFAVSLPYSPLDKNAQTQTVNICAQELLTPFGLRSLSPYDSHYQPHWKGNMAQRDRAYHQGSTWVWLLGHFALAQYRVTGDVELALRHLDAISPLLKEGGVGVIGELFDGAPAYLAGGTPAQAWSVACLLEAWWKLERTKRKQNLKPPELKPIHWNTVRALSSAE